MTVAEQKSINKSDGAAGAVDIPRLLVEAAGTEVTSPATGYVKILTYHGIGSGEPNDT